MPNMDSMTPIDTETDTRIQSLITLLADDDPQVGDAIAHHLRDMGPVTLPGLEAALQSDHPTLRERAGALVREMRLEQVLLDLRQFANGGAKSLEQGLYLLARLNDPDFDQAACTEQLNRMTEDLMLRLDPGDGVDILLSAWSRYLYNEQGFAGNTEDYYQPSNSYLNTLLTSRKGIPISLSSLYIILGQRLGLPIYGIGMPGHFLAKYDDGHEMRIIDPFHKGRVLDEAGCSQLLRGLGLAFDSRYLTPVTTRYIMERTVKNLVALFAERSMAEPLKLHQRALEALRPTT